jgi:hypothetical protein
LDLGSAFSSLSESKNTKANRFILQNCLLETSETHTPLYKRETMRLMALTASAHRDSVQAFLPRLLSSVLKNIRVKMKLRKSLN